MIYLDNAATSYPKPGLVKKEVSKCFCDYIGNPGRSGHSASLKAAEAIYRTRRAVANFMDCDEEECIVFTQNATHSLNIAIRALVKQGDHVLLSDMEHNSVLRPLYKLKQEGVLTYSVFSHAGNILENLEKAYNEKTRILICTHISNVTAEILPVFQIRKFCKEKNIIFILDASQSLGHIPVSVKEIGCDVLCAPGHKGLMGIQGAGILYMSGHLETEDVFQGGSGTGSLSPIMPNNLPDRLEVGTLPTPAIVSMGAGIRWIEKQGLTPIATHIKNYANSFREELLEIPGFHIVSPKDALMFSFYMDDVPSEDIADGLSAKKIYVRGGFHCSYLAHKTLGTQKNGIVRLSPSCFSSQKEVGKVLDALWRLIKNRQ